MSERYPNWILNFLISNEASWKKAFKSTFQNFEKKFTLHDSYWVMLHYNVLYDDTIILVIDWNVVWLPSCVKQQLSSEASLVLLFIKLYKTRQISSSGYENWKEPYLIQRSISGHEIEVIGKEHLLVISDLWGGCVEIIFSGEAEFLAVTQEQLSINLSES